MPSLAILCAFSFVSFLICAFWRVISNNVFFRKAPTIPIKDATYNCVAKPLDIHQTSTVGS